MGGGGGGRGGTIRLIKADRCFNKHSVGWIDAGDLVYDGLVAKLTFLHSLCEK